MIARKLADYAESHHYKGYDPYDMLNSPLAGVLSLGTKFGRIALTQLGRRSPVNFRPLLLIRPGVNPKALALFLEGTVRLYRSYGEDNDLKRMTQLVQLLAEMRSPNVSGSAWGYHFPWQNRYQCLPRYTPTIVNSACVCSTADVPGTISRSTFWPISVTLDICVFTLNEKNLN